MAAEQYRYQRYPLQLEDESDSDAEVFIPPVQGTVQFQRQTKTAIGAGKMANTKRSKADDVMNKSVLKPGFEQLDVVPRKTRTIEKKRNRLERVKTAGDGWFNMKAPEVTEEVKQNLEVLQMRGAINKNRVYKKNDMRTLPKYFAMGTVVEHATDFYSSRIPKRQRKKTLVEELMADVEAKKQLKKQATKLAVKKQLKAQSKPARKKKPFRRRKMEMD